MTSVSAPLVLNQKLAAKALGLTARQLRNLQDDGAPSTVADSGQRLYDLAELVPWYMAKKLDEARRDQTELDQAKLEKARLEVRRRQVEVAKAEGSVIDIEHHDEVVEKLVAAFRLAALSLPGTWGARVVGIPDPAEGTEAMRLVAEDLLRTMQSKADELEVAAGPADSPLPEDFPGYRSLAAAGVTTYDELRLLGDPTTVKGIGPKTAERIVRELEEAA